MLEEPTLLGILTTWFPMFLLIGVWLFMFGRTGGFKRGAMTQGQYLQAILDETRRQNAALETIIARMDARLSRLEAVPPAAKSDEGQG